MDLELRVSALEEVKETRRPTAESAVILKFPVLSLESYPEGQVGGWLIAVLNIFGKRGVESGGDVPDRVDRNWLLTRMCEEMDVTDKVAKDRLRTLKNGHYLREEFGCVKFPVDRWKNKPGGP
jgi:hypothetical protein